MLICCRVSLPTSLAVGASLAAYYTGYFTCPLQYRLAIVLSGPQWINRNLPPGTQANLLAAGLYQLPLDLEGSYSDCWNTAETSSAAELISFLQTGLLIADSPIVLYVVLVSAAVVVFLAVFGMVMELPSSSVRVRKAIALKLRQADLKVCCSPELLQSED
jgi:hypothetical protein